MCNCVWPQCKSVWLRKQLVHYTEAIMNFYLGGKGSRGLADSGCRTGPFTGLRPGEVQEAIMVTSTGEELPIRGK